MRSATCHAAAPLGSSTSRAARLPAWNAIFGAPRGYAAPTRRPALVQQQQQGRRRQQRLVSVAAAGGPQQETKQEKQERRTEQLLIAGIGVGLTALVVLILRLGGDALQGAEVLGLGAPDDSGAGLGLGDIAGGLLWAGSLYFCSPIQLLLLFFGSYDRERPSDWVLRVLGRAAGQDVEAIDYRVPLAVQGATLALFGGSGLGIAYASQAFLGDATWCISTGLGACFGAAMYETARPRRLSVDEAQELEAQWQVFSKWADGRLQRGGRCHETEVWRAFRRAHPRYRTEALLGDNVLRDLISNWHGRAQRSQAGYYKNLSLAPSTDAFGSSTGTALASSSSSGTAAEQPSGPPPVAAPE